MKTSRLLLVFLALIMLFTICSCKRKDPNQTETTPAVTETTPVESITATTEPTQTTEPVETTTAPVETTTAPVETTTAPVETTTAPVETTTAPVETTTAPVETTTAPVETTTAPVETTTAPVETTTAPVETTAPAETSTSVETTEKPVDPVEPHVHRYTDWVTLSTATCTTSGRSRGTCSCGDTKIRTISPQGHQYGEEVILKQPDCENAGLKQKTCQECGHVNTVEIPKGGHVEVIIEAVKPTCTTPGTTEGKTCSVCQTVLVPVEVVPAQHTPEVIPAVPATCTATGLTEGSRCSGCGTVLVPQLPTALVAHTFTNYVSNNNASCTVDGTATAKCDFCDATDVKIELGSAHGHKPGETWQYNTAQHYHVCTVCNVSVDAAAHQDAETCICGYQKPAEACKHDVTLTWVPAKESTCKEIGNVGYYVCPKCSAWFEDKEATKEITDHSTVYLPVSGHVELTVTEAKAATCSEVGTTAHVICKVCETVLKQGTEIPMIEHTYVTDKAVAPTCVENGKTEGVHCSACSAVLVAQQTVPATGVHEYDVTTVAATCTENGSTVHQCKHCTGRIETVLPALGHKAAENAEWTTVTDETTGEAVLTLVEGETCLYSGEKYTSCAACGAKIVDTYRLEKHQHVGVITTAATCQTEGVKTYTCVCNNTYTEAVPVDANAHAWSAEPVDGKYICTVEGCTASKVVIDNTDSSTAGLNKDTLTDAKDNDLEVNLKDATIKMDSGIVNDLGTQGKDVELSADKLEESKRDEVTSKLDDSAKDKIGDSPIYDFNLTVDQEKISFEGKMVVTLPYTLAEGEDADHVAVAYIDDEGNLTLIPATYFEQDGEGYVTFETDHFSAFSPVVIEDEDLCAVYGHKLYDVVVKATCLTDGYTNRYCSVCDHAELELDKVPAKGHTYVSTITPATCIAQGYTTKVCSDCGHTVIGEYTNFAEHVMVAASVVAATCTEEGYTVEKCSVCGYSRLTAVVPALGHAWGEAVVTKDATCAEQGTKTATCTHEGCTATQNTVIPAKGHVAQATDAKAPTCTEAGHTKGYVCTVCGETLVEATVIPATGHVELIIARIEPTCTSVGYTQGMKCAACGEVITVPVEIAMLPHTEVPFGKIDATCTKPGYESGTKCSVCETVLKSATETPALGHKEELLAAVAPTCTKTGLTEGKKCSVCGEILVAQQEIPALGHKEEIVSGVAATCTKTGLTEGKKCSVCGEILVAQQEIPALGHKEEIIPGVAATCTKTGLTEGKKCSVCGEILVAQQEIPALGHKEEIIPGVAATCTKTGLTEGKKCTACGEILVAPVEIAMLPHTEVPFGKIEPTCTTPGYESGTKCSVCETVLKSATETPALGHKEEILPGKAPTRYEEGLTEGKKCSVCQTVLVEQQTIPALLSVYTETFDREDSADTEAILNALGWNQLTFERDGVVSESNARFEIKDGKLYFTNYADDIAGKDSYYEIAALSGEHMTEIFRDAYTLQYDVNYTKASNRNRYVNFITEYTVDGRYYNTFHFRVTGYGNNQCWYDGVWLDYDIQDENDMCAEVQEDYEGALCTTICKKLLGIDYDPAKATFYNVPVTIRVVYDPVTGPAAFMKTAEMEDFVQVSKYSVNSEAADFNTWKAWEGSMVAFKIGAKINGWIDNVYLWRGNGDLPTGHEHTWSDWTVTSEADCTHKAVETRTCDACDQRESRLTNALGHTYGEDNVCDTCGVKKHSEGLSYVLREDGTVAVDGIGSCTDTEIIIPEKLPDGRVVTAIVWPAFDGNTEITKVSIPDTITYIESAAFYGCTNLTYNNDGIANYLGNDENPYLVLMSVVDMSIESFEFYPQTKIIYEDAFHSCHELISVEIPEGITQIQSMAFGNCSGLISVSIPSTTTHIEPWAFHNSHKLESIVIAEGNPVYHTTDNCVIETATKTLVIGISTSKIPAGGEEVTTIGYNSFCGVKFETVVIPEGITLIDGLAFQSCSDIRYVQLPKSLTEIGFNVFSNCTRIKYVFYAGSEEEWEKILVDSTNDEIPDSRIAFYTETEPSEEENGNYWRYVDGVPTLWKTYQHFADGTVIYEEKFDYPDSKDTQNVLNTINWTKLTQMLNGVYNETDAEFAIVDGRLYFDNWDEIPVEGDTRVRGRDGYYSINVLNDDVMAPVVEGKYTLQYDLVYVGARDRSRYAAIITECSANGLYYNSFHFRVGGFANHQMHYEGRWMTFDAFDPATDLYAASQATSAAEAATKGTPICYKLLGEYFDADKLQFINVPVTIKYQWEPGVGHHVYMKTAEMVDFIKVSEPSIYADGINFVEDWIGSSVQFKLGAAVDGYIDNIRLWTGWGDMTEDGHLINEWTVETESTCTEQGTASGICTKCGEKITKQLVLKAHTYSDWTETTAPTCSAFGIETATCVCGATATRETAKLPHVFEGENCVSCGRGYNYDLAFGLYKTNGVQYYRVTGIGKCTDTEIYIPAMYNGLPVLEINSNAFSGKTTITKVVIADGVTTIYGSAFNNCTALTELILPETLTSTNLFFNGLNDDVFTIDENGAKYLGTASNPYFLLAKVNTNTKVTTLELHPDTKLISQQAIQNCNAVESIVIPEGVVGMGDYAIYMCKNLKTVSIPSTVASIGCLFGDCPSITEITVHADNPVYMSAGNCIIEKETKTLVCGSASCVIPSDGSVTIIGSHAFEEIPVTTLVIPEGVVTINDRAFFCCADLVEISLPSTLTSVGIDIFRDCNRLTTIRIAESNTAFRVVDNCLIANADDALVATTSKATAIPEGVKKIGDYAFYNSQIAEIVIPDGVTTIGSYAFNGCTVLTEIRLPEGLTGIGNYAFRNCTKLVSIEIPDTVKTIGTYAFYGCTALTEVKLPASLTSISNYTFRNCTNLTTVTIPASVTKIGNYVFNGCNNLKVVYFEGTAAEWAKVTIGSNNNSLNQAEVICTGVERPGVLVFEENFDYADNSDTISVLDIIGWSKLTKAENRVYSETDAEFAIIDGRLYFDNWDANGLPEGDTRVRGKDGYYSINALNHVVMMGIVENKYTLQYDLEYVDAKNQSGYATILTDGSLNGQMYNSYHFRISGFGNNQAHRNGSWMTYDSFDPATDLYAASQSATAAEAATKGTPISYKLLGKYFDRTLMFKNVKVTIKLQWEPEMGHHVYMKTENMVDFVKVSEPSIYADGPMYVGSWDGWAVWFKLGNYIDGYIDNIALWTGWGEKPEAACEHVPGEMEVISKQSCTEHGITRQICTICGLTIDGSLEPATGHQVKEWITVSEPTCTESGHREGVCVTCGLKQTSTIKATGHKINEWTVVKAPTCKETGINEGICTVCGATSQINVATVKHTYSEWIPTQAATCTTAGIETSSCIYGCGLSQTRESAMLLHDFSNGNCSMCGRLPYSAGLAYTLSKDGKYYTVSGIGSCTDKDIYIPATYEGLPVTEIANRAFHGNNNIVRVVMPDSITRIGYNVFNNSQSLVTVVLSENISFIDTYCFGNIPSLVYTMDEMGGMYLGTATNPYFLLVDVQDISIREYEVNAATKYIYSSVFSNCRYLTSVIIPESVRVIGSQAFQYCESLETVVIPEGVISVDDYVFHGCTSLKSVSIPASVTDMGYNFFAYCPSIEEVIIHADNPVFANVGNCIVNKKTGGIYSGCVSSVIPNDGSILRIENNAFQYVPITSIILPEGLTRIGSYAFRGCDQLSGDLVIPSTVTTIGNGTFSGCSAITSLVVAQGNSTFYVQNNCLIRIKDNCLVTAVGNVTVIPEGVASIGNQAFYGCTMTEIKLPNTLQSIASDAFYNCDQLVSVKLPDSVITVSNYAFENCDSLQTVVLSKGLTAINNYVFVNCKALTTITIPDSITSIGQNAFSGCNSLSTIIYLGTEEQWNAITVASGNTALANATVKFVPANQSLAYTELADGTLAVSGIGNVTSTEIVIPAEVDGKPVTQIASGAFQKNTKFTSVVIPDSVKYIGTYAFGGCKLSNLDLGAGVVEIGSNAFQSAAIKQLVLPESLKVIGSNAFSSATMSEVILPVNLEFVGSNAFSNCKNLTYVYIPKSLVDMNATAFSHTPNITKFEIEKGNDNFKFVDGCLINVNAKMLMHGGANAVIPTDGSVEVIGMYAFADVDNLGVLTIPNSVIAIETYAFMSCENLTEVVIPASVDYIAQDAFRGCYQLAKFTVDSQNAYYHVAGDALIETASKTLIRGTATTVIPTDGSVTAIGKDAFYGVNGLTSLSIPKTIQFLGQYAVAYCNDLTKLSLPATLQEIPNSCFRNNIALGSITIPNGVTRIGSNAFAGCSSLTAISIPATVTYIAESAFNGCKALTTINYAGTKEEWALINILEKGNTVIFNATIVCKPTEESLAYTELSDGTLAVSGIGNVTAKEIVIPAEVNGKPVTQIASSAFSKKTTFSSVIIPDSVVRIGSNAFNACKSLTTVTLGSGLQMIDSGAFQSTAIKQIVLPESLITIGSNAFFMCSKLNHVYIPKSLTEIGATAFGRTASIQTIVVEEGNPAYKFVDGCLIDIANKALICGTAAAVIPSDGSVEVIASQAFSDVDNLNSIVIPEGVTTIQALAFMFCEGLNEVTLPASVTYVDQRAFRGCYDLSVFNVNEKNVAYHVAGNALIETASKTLIRGGKDTVIPSDGSVTVLGYDSFSYIYDLGELVIPEGITTIGNNAFENCKNLTAITIPTSVASIEGNALGSIKTGYPATINYCGSQEQWAMITIASTNDFLDKIQINFNYTPAVAQ